MKRIFVSVLCLCLCVTAAACGRPDVTPETSDLSVVSDVSTTTTATTTTEESTTTTQETTTTTATTTLGRTTGGGNGGGYDCIGIPTRPTTTTTTTTVKPTTTTIQEQTVDLSAYALAQSADVVNEKRVYDGYTDGLVGYYSRVLPAFLDGDSGSNRLYLALAMLAETAAGNSRRQILDLLGEQDTDALGRRAAALWNSVYSDKSGAQCRLANSLWLDEYTVPHCSVQTVDRLADPYYASVFRGKMGTKEYDAILQEWLNKNTGGLLKEQAGGESFPGNGAFSLVSTIYFKVDWEKAFNEQKTRERSFNTDSNQGVVQCDFMNDSTKNTYYWKGEEFIAINRTMNGNYSMWYVLPNEDVRVDNMLHSQDVLGMVTGTGGGAQRINCDLVTAVPKFDVTYKKDLSADIRSLGATDVFDPMAADLTALLGENAGKEACVGGVSHAVRIVSEEKGVEAAAYTGITVAMKGTSTTTRVRPLIYFTADRPFMFVITGPDGSILFAGVIGNPTLK